jgi:hypothetical protein
MKYNVFKERDNTVYCFGHRIGLELPKMLSPTDRNIIFKTKTETHINYETFELYIIIVVYEVKR